VEIRVTPEVSVAHTGHHRRVRLVLNILWLILGGFLIALGYAIAGLICFVFVVTIPFGIASFRMANYALWPFGRTVVPKPRAGVASAIGNVIWFVVAGWWLALGHILTAVAQAVTIIGIPLAIANIKLIPVSLFPLGHEIVDVDVRRVDARRPTMRPAGAS
jgi:uncharacterized membrane protein YccF (DUF307 family)